MPGPGVVGQHDVGRRQRAHQRAEVLLAGEGADPPPGVVDRGQQRLRQPGLRGVADHRDPDPVRDERPDHRREPLDRPVPPRVAGPGVHDHGRRAVEGRVPLLLLGRAQVDPRLQPDRLGTGQGHHLQPAQHLVLEVQEGAPPLELRGVVGPAADGVPRAQPEQEGVGVAAAAVQLHREVVALRPGVREERRRRRRVLDARLDAGPGRQRQQRPVRGRPLGQQGEVAGRAQQRQRGVGVRRRQGLRGRQRLHEVAEPAAPQHRHPAHVGEAGSRPPHPGPLDLHASLPLLDDGDPAAPPLRSLQRAAGLLLLPSSRGEEKWVGGAVMGTNSWIGSAAAGRGAAA